MAINVPLNAQLQNATQLQQQIQNAVNSVRINLGGQNGARALSSLSQPLGRLTGQADEFTKSLDAANARVLAFGASVGVVNAVTSAFKSLVNSTIEVEKAITAISVVGDQFTGKTKELSQGLFSIAKATGQSFSEVSKAALEFSRQGLALEDTLSRTQDALILTRLTGLDAAKSVDGLTAAVNAFSKAGLSTTQIINKLAAVDQAYAVSSADLIEGFNRSAAVAQNAGLTFDELAGIITALQQETSRGGAVIGNALKTIFTRLQDTSTLNRLSDLGIAVKDLQNNLLPARQILQNLANDVEGLGQITKAGIFKDVAGTFQINQLISLVGDLNKQNSIAAGATLKSAGATKEAYIANEKLNQSLDAVLGKVANTGKQLGSILGELGLTDNLKGLLDGINSFLEGASSLLQGDDLGSNFAKGFVKGIGAVLSGPGIGLFLAIIGKLSLDLAKFGAQSLKTFFGIGKAAADQKLVQESIVQTLIRNQGVANDILTTQGGQNAKALKFLELLDQQAAAMRDIQRMAGGIAPAVYARGYRATTDGGLQSKGKAAGGYLPAQEASDVRRGVGGASPSSKVVAIPNFAFGGGKRGTMIANTSEYIVPNYAGGGSAIFNQDMVRTMGLPAGAKKISAAGGYVPNFAATNQDLAVFGLYGKNNGDINGSPVYTLQGQSANLTKNIEKEYQVRIKSFVRGYSQELANQIGVKRTPREVIKALQQTSQVSGFIFEDVLNQLAGPEFDSNRISGGARADFPLTPNLRKVFGATGAQKYAEVKLDPYTTDSVNSIKAKQAALAAGAFAPQSIPKDEFDKLRSRAISLGIGQGGRIDTKTQSQRNAFIKELIGAGIIKSDYGTSANQNKAIKRALGIASGGYVPNFADLDGDGTVTQRDGFYQRLKSAAKKYSKNPLVDFALNQVLQSMLGLPEGIEVTEIIKSCDKALKGIQPEIELNKILREKAANKKQQKRKDFLAKWRSSSGHIPNFAAAALQQAIAREKSAGLSDSQIYVDQSAALKSPMNPMGLMVANRRDEPAGGFQGISRARKEGMNPKLYGAAGGFVPNYAVQAPIGQIAAIKGVLAQDKVDAFNKALEDTAKQLKSNQISLSQAEQNIEIYAQTVGTSARGEKILESEGKKLIQAYDAESKARKQKAEELRKQRSEKQIIPEPAKSPKSTGDALAKVFALQSAFVGLSALFDTVAEGSEFANNFRKFDGVLTGIASASILLTAGLGPLGIALAAITGGFNIVKSLWPNAIQQMSEAFGGLSKAGQEASNNLDKFGEKIASGGLTTQQALADAKRQAEDAQLRVKAKQQGLSTESSEGQQKDTTKLARELIFTNLEKKSGEKELFKGIDFYNPAQGTTGNIKYKDLNKSSKNVINDFFEEAISTNAEGLIALAKEIDVDIPKDVLKFTKDQLSDFRTDLLDKILFSEGEISLILQQALFAARDENLTFNQNKFQEAIKNGGLPDFIVKLIEASLKNLPSVEAAKPENQIQVRLDEFLLSYQNFSNEINRSVAATTALFEGALSSQAFSSLSETRQSQLKTQLDRFKFTTASQKREKDIVGEARILATNQAKNLAATQGDPDLQNRLDKFATTFSNLDSLESELNSFAKEVTLAGEESEKFKQQVADLINKNKDFQSSREVEKTLLEFSIQERENELNAIQTFYKGLSEFDKGIREKEGQLRKLDFQKALIDQTAQFEKELAQITSNSPEELRARTREVENRRVREELRISGTQGKIQAEIERDRALNTLENITALNKNTKALEELLKQISIENLQKELQQITLGAAGRTITPEESARIATITGKIGALTNPAPSDATASKSPLSYLNTIQSPADIETALSGIANEQEKAKYRQIFETYFDRMQQVGEEEARRLTLLENGNNQEDALNRIRDSYIDDFSQELTSLRASQTSPKSRGEYRATERQIDRIVKQQGMTPEGVRDYRSSLGYGLDQGFEELEKRTLDYKQELGVEIPRLFSSNLAQGLNDAISGAKSLKEALSDAATSFFQEITRRNISNLADLVTSGFGSFAKSGAQALGFASGGLIKGGSGTKDDIPAMLMGGEYVMKKSAVNKYGKGFLDALNNGKMRGYATGGLVDPQTFPTQTGRGGFFTPGDYGQGAITGKNELLTFATQSFTGGQYDYMGGFGMGGATIGLESESARLSAFGRENSPMFERVQQSKDEAFKVYLEGLQKEKEYAELLDQIAKDKKARKKQLQTAIISAVVSSAASYAGTRGKTGAKNSIAGAATSAGEAGLSSWQKLKAGTSGFFKGIFTSSGGKLTDAAKDYFKSKTLEKNLDILSENDLPKMGLKNFGNDSFYNPYPSSRSNTGSLALPNKPGSASGFNYLLPPRRASGGLISGGSNIRDDVPTMLTGGEFVLNNRATQRIGLQNLNKLNNGQSVGGEGASAEMTQALISKLDELIQATQNSSSENVVVNVSSNEAGGQNQENPAGAEKELHKKIRQAVLDVIAQEKRLGGSLEKSR